MKVKSESEVAQSCLTLSDPMDWSLPGSSVHGIFQARVLEWGAIAFSILRLGYNKTWQLPAVSDISHWKGGLEGGYHAVKTLKHYREVHVVGNRGPQPRAHKKLRPPLIAVCVNHLGSGFSNPNKS